MTKRFHKKVLAFMLVTAMVLGNLAGFSLVSTVSAQIEQSALVDPGQTDFFINCKLCEGSRKFS